MMQHSEPKAEKYVAENVAHFIEFTSKYNEHKFDFSEESLEGVNDQIKLFAGHYSHMGGEELIDYVNVQVGSYLIEVARKKFDGALYWNKELNQPVFLIGIPHFQVHFQPFKKVRYLLKNDGSNDDVFLFWKTLIDAVSSSKEGDEKYV